MSWAKNQSTSKRFAQATTTRTLAYASNLSKIGNLLALRVSFFPNSSTLTVTDSQGNTWTQVGTYTTAGSGSTGIAVAIFTAKAGAMAADTVSVAPSVSTALTLAISEWQPPGSSTLAADSHASNTTGSTLTVPTNTCTVSNSDDLVLAACATRTTQTAPTVNSPFTLGETQFVGGSNAVLIAAHDANANSSEGCTFNLDTLPSASVAIIASFKATGGSAAQGWPYSNSYLSGGFAGLTGGL